MPALDSSNISSGNNNDLQDSVKLAKNNKLLLDNISKIYNYDNKIQIPMSFLRKYENILKSYLYEIDLPKNYYYRPEYLSNEIFNTTDLWYIILFINDMKSPLEFCTEKVKVPINAYSMEIINKIQNIEKDVSESHNNPIKLERHLIKDVNFSSDRVIKTSNKFRKKSVDSYSDGISKIKKLNLLPLNVTQYILSNNYVTINDNEILYTSLPNSLCTFEEVKMTGNKNPIISLPNPNSVNILKTDYNYISYLNHDINYVLLKFYNGLSNFILTNKSDNTFEMNLTRNKNEVKFNTPLLSYDLRESGIYSETDNKEIKHSNEKWSENLIKFNENFGGYVNIKTFESISSGITDVIRIDINLKDDLISNKLDLNDYAFLGFDVYYYFTDSNINDVLLFSPMSITYKCIDSNNNEFSKTFTLPYSNNLYNTDTIKNIKRILPIIYNCETKERPIINSISISCRVKVISDEKSVNHNFSVGLSAVQIYGFKYEEIVKEFQIPDEKTFNDLNFNFNYSYDYSNKYKGYYFEPSIFKRDMNILDKLTDENNLDLNHKNNIITKNEDVSLHINNDIIKINKDLLKDETSTFNDNFNTSVMEYTINNFNLDYSFILELEIKRNNVTSGSTSAISIKFDLNKDDGYLLHIGDFDNTDIPDLSLYKETKEAVLSNGLYKLTQNGSTNSKIFKYVDSLTINHHEIFINNTNLLDNVNIYKLKISKSGKLINIDFASYDEINRKYNSYTTLYSLTDVYYPYENITEYNNSFDKHSLSFTTYYNPNFDIIINKYLISDES